MDDQKIIVLLWDRVESAIDALKAKFGKTLYRIAMNILSDHQEAEEAENDTYLALWNAIPPARPDPLAPFVYRTGRNVSLKILRNRSAQKRNRGYEVSLEELSQIIPGGTMEEAMDERALGQAINRFLGTLGKEDRVLFVRRYWFGDDITSLSKLTGLSPTNVSVRLYRIRAKLKDYLTEEGFWL